MFLCVMLLLLSSAATVVAGDGGGYRTEQNWCRTPPHSALVAVERRWRDVSCPLVRVLFHADPIISIFRYIRACSVLMSVGVVVVVRRVASA